MTPERWRQIEDLYSLACDRGDGVLAEADPDLRREVQELLAQKSGGKIPDQAAFDLMMDSTQTQVTAGSRLGPYQIEGLPGQGGMGDVFRATDTRLGREVAILLSCAPVVHRRLGRVYNPPQADSLPRIRFRNDRDSLLGQQLV
jgi:hypothetical protein